MSFQPPNYNTNVRHFRVIHLAYLFQFSPAIQRDVSYAMFPAHICSNSSLTRHAFTSASLEIMMLIGV